MTISALARLLLAALTVTAGLAQAADNVRFSSDPPGAHVCVQSRGVLDCSAVTPATLNVDLATDNESRRYFFKRIGYRTEAVLVTAKDSSVQAVLKPSDVFFDPGKHRDAGLQDIQRNVNQALRRRLYASNSEFSGIDAELVGQVTVTRSEGRTLVQVGMLVTNTTRRREIGAAARSTSGREPRLASAAMSGEASRIHGLIHGAVGAVPGVDALAFSVNYTKASAVLTEETVQFLRTYVTGSYTRYTGGGKTELVTEYTTVRHRGDVTRVEDEIGVRSVLVITPIKGYSPQHEDDAARILRSSDVYLNDNRRKAFALVQVD